MSTEIDAVLGFWQRSSRDWFSHSPVFDARFRNRFLSLHERGARGELVAWADAPRGALALLILLDQFPRNAFRSTVRMYATDELALAIARESVQRGDGDQLPQDLLQFLFLPFAHSESVDDQELSVELHGVLGPPWLTHAQEHRDIIRRFGRFGRFPHRNAILGRRSTPDEIRYLAEGGFKG